MVETLTINGTAYPLAELEALIGADALEPPYDTDELQTLIDEANRESSNALEELLVAALLLALIPNFTPGGLAYIARDGRYYQGRSPLTTTDLQLRVLTEQAQNQARMQRLTDRMVAGDVSLEQWQRAMGRDIVRSHFRMAQAGAGTAGQLTPEHLERLRRQIVADLDGLANLAQGIADGEISEKMARYRAGRYGYSAGASFFDAQHQSHLDGRWMARRMLDPAADHCPDCPGLARPDWIPAAEVTPVGVDCRCRGRCRCRVEYRMATLSDRLPVPATAPPQAEPTATLQPGPERQTPPSNRTAAALKWAKPTSMPSNERLRTVEVGTIYEDWRRNGLPIDLSNPNERARIDRLKTDILRSSESGEPFTAPRLSFAEPGNEFNIPPGYDITDGRHRLVAFYELGFRTIRAWVEK